MICVSGSFPGFLGLLGTNALRVKPFSSASSVTWQSSPQ
jgi:hypothetical protein